jgi:hypothetical protein
MASARKIDGERDSKDANSGCNMLFQVSCMYNGCNFLFYSERKHTHVHAGKRADGKNTQHVQVWWDGALDDATLHLHFVDTEVSSFLLMQLVSCN